MEIFTITDNRGFLLSGSGRTLACETAAHRIGVPAGRQGLATMAARRRAAVRVWRKAPAPVVRIAKSIDRPLVGQVRVPSALQRSP